MADIANIGFAVETAQLEKGVASLNKLSTASKSANASAQAIGSSMTTAAKTFAGAVAGMSKSVYALVSATKSSTVEQIAAAKEAMDFANNIYKAANAQDKLAISTDKVTKSVKNMYSAMFKAASGEKILDRINRITGVSTSTGLVAEEVKDRMALGYGKADFAERSGEYISSRGLTEAQQISRFNTSNIAAQFQDIAVTAAMGMNPLTVALQQGTQLASVLNLMEKPLEGVAQAFKSLINPVSLISIGLTALLVVGLQVVDWGKLGVSTMEALAGAFDFVARNADKFAVVLAGVVTSLIAFNAKTILINAQILLLQARLLLVKTGILALKGLELIVAGLFNPFLLGVGLVAAGALAFKTFKDDVKNYLSETVEKVVEFVNKTIGYFTGLKNVIKNIDEVLKTGLTDGLSAANDKITKIMNDAMSVKYIDDEDLNNIKNIVNNAVDTVASGIEYVEDKVEQGANAAKEAVNSLKQKIIENTDAFKKAQEESEKLQKSWEKLLATAQQDTKDIEFELKVAGKDTWDETYMRTMYELEKQARQEGIVLDRTKLDLMKQEATDRANATVALENYNDEIELQQEIIGEVKDVTKGFFRDLRDGLQEGKSGWEAFGDAALNVLNKIQDKMMDMAIDAAFDGSGGGNGWLGTLLKTGISAAMTYFGGGQPTNLVPDAAAGATSSPGFAVDTTGPMVGGLYAKGGVFSNGVVDSPTLFKFAKGGKFGVMGEAGPEAVMPLSRGPDGSLGVRMDGANSSQSPVVVNVINNSDSQARTEERQTEHGLEIDVIIDKMVAEKMGRPGTASNSALKAYNSQSLIQR